MQFIFVNPLCEALFKSSQLGNLGDWLKVRSIKTHELSLLSLWILAGMKTSMEYLSLIWMWDGTQE